MSTHASPPRADGPAPRGSSALRALVHGSDTAALLIGWLAIITVLDLIGHPIPQQSVQTGAFAVVTVGLLALRAAGTHDRRTARVRSRELAGTCKASLAPGFIVLAIAPQPTVLWSLLVASLSAFVWMTMLGISRAMLGEWVRGNRARGHLSAPVIVVGTGRAAELASFLRHHPHLGFSVADVVELLPDTPGTVEMLLAIRDSLGATGVIISDPGDPVVAPLIPALGNAGLHVHVATGVQGMDKGGAITSSLAGELFLDFAPTQLPRWEASAIRALDVAIVSFVLAITAPASALVALAIKLTDRGPVLYVADRVGLGGDLFPMLKFRSMRHNAPPPVIKLDNGREGPLTKIDGDPRITRIGRLIRATSLDEIPQLVNVLRGDMSIVGPRPALASEVAEFDDELMRRVDVRPGLTGLWQVEGRDLPSFELYRRLDLLYVDNMSLSLYLAVLLRTATALIGQTLRSLLNGSETTLTPRSTSETTIMLPDGSKRVVRVTD